MSRYARTSDPETSHESSRSLDHRLRTKHYRVLVWLLVNGPASDDEISVAMVEEEVVGRQESGRRLVRTCREVYGLIEPATDAQGSRIIHTNESGRPAQCWRLARRGRVIAILARHRLRETSTTTLHS